MIVNPYTQKPEPPVDIVRRLQQIDPRLGLAWSETLDPKTDKLRDCWMFTMAWLPTDKRHRMVQEGQLPLDTCYDCLAFLPFDCSVEQAYGYVVRTFKQLNHKEDMQKLLERVHTFNQAAKAENLRETNELLEDLLETNKQTLRPGSTKAVSSPVSKHRVTNKRKELARIREYMEQ